MIDFKKVHRSSPIPFKEFILKVGPFVFERISPTLEPERTGWERPKLKMRRS